MRTGIEIKTSTGYVYVPYSKVVFVRREGKSSFQVVTSSGHRVFFTDEEVFERLKNYVLMKHPVLDNIREPI